MEQTVKERLVGAAVLLILGVIVIPWVLDGSQAQINQTENLVLPIPEGEITHELNFKDGNLTKIDLPVPGNTSTDKKQSSGATEKPVTESSTPKVEPPTPKTTVEISTPKPEPEPKQATDSDTKTIDRTVESKPVPSTNTQTTNTTAPKQSTETERVANDPTVAWVVQVGSFSNQMNAEKQVLALKVNDFPAFISRYVTPDKKVLYRVRVGPEKDRARAEKLQERLLKSDMKGQVVAHP